MISQSPPIVGEWEFPEWHEYMRYLYLPVAILGHKSVRLPHNVEFLRPLIDRIIWREQLDVCAGMGYFLPSRYVYVSAQRGFATPENPLNRPGWHADGFGTDDINYVWADRYPTRFAVGDFGEISNDHVESAREFDERVKTAHGLDIDTYEGRPNALYRLDNTMVHATPRVPEPGGERGFIKISVSNRRYNLRGNSHNYLFDYDWPMHSRAEIRNDPAYAGSDSGPQ